MPDGLSSHFFHVSLVVVLPRGTMAGKRESYNEIPPATRGPAGGAAPPQPRQPEMSPARTVTVDAAVDSLGTGRFQLRILFAAGLCFAADSMEIMLLSFLSTILRAQWDLTDAQTATITGVVFLGALSGTLVLGPLGDRRGRRPVFLACGTIISVFGTLTAVAWDYPSLLATRFLVGFGVGGLTVPFDILAEFVPTEVRGRYLLLIEFFWTAGSMAVPAVAWLTVGSGHSWQIFVMVCAIPCLASLLLGAWLVPESPRWLLSRGRGGDALLVLRAAAASNGIDPDALFPPGTALMEVEAEGDGRSGLQELLSARWRRTTLLIWGAWLGFAFGYYGTIIAVTRVFEVDAEEGGGGNGNGDVDFDYGAIFISSSAEIVGTALVVFLVDRVGRIRSQVAAYIIGGICLSLLCFFGESEFGSRPFLLSMAFGARVCEMMGSCVTWVTTAEVLPTEIRATGHSAANAVARFGGFFSPYLVGAGVPLPAVGGIMLFIHAATALCASKLPETKGKRLGHGAPTGSDGGQSETELAAAPSDQSGFLA